MAPSDGVPASLNGQFRSLAFRLKRMPNNLSRLVVDYPDMSGLLRWSVVRPAKMTGKDVLRTL